LFIYNAYGRLVSFYTDGRFYSHSNWCIAAIAVTLQIIRLLFPALTLFLQRGSILFYKTAAPFSIVLLTYINTKAFKAENGSASIHGC
jgi:hypothetical protein